MSLELNLCFPDPNTVVIKLDEQESERLPFVCPLTEADQQEIRWYLEIYASAYTTEVDDERADRIAQQLPSWGAALFEAVFQDRMAQRLFNDFQDQPERGRLLTISASHPAILSLPWELLRDPVGTYLVHDNPRISIRRRLAGAGGGRRPFPVRPKAKLRLLMVISRPTGAGFIDPRGEAIAVLDAIEQAAPGQVEVEFLRPPTLDKLRDRLEDERLPAVDIVHFDGHGAYDPDGRLHDHAKQSDPVAATKGNSDASRNIGYLLFEDAEGKTALISAETLGEMLNRQRVGLIVLSACQSAAVAGEDAMGSVAARLTHAGIPAVLAMTHSVLVVTTRQLFAAFYQHLGEGKGMGEALDNARRHLKLHPERGERQRFDQRVTLKLQDWFLPALYQSGRDTALLIPPPPLEKGGLEEGSLAEGSLAASSANASPLVKGGQGGSDWSNLPPLQEAGFFGRSRELWQIERVLANRTRRLTISGFGGQGKTALAQEAGRWLHRTELIDRVCFVDYSGFQGVDAVGLAVSTLGTVLQQSFLDADAVTTYLRTSQAPRLLLILDNLEVITEPALRELLDSASAWSETRCRVLLTSRSPDFHHPHYPTEGSWQHLALPLSGLGSERYPDDAIAYFQVLSSLPPAPTVPAPSRNALIHLFKLVDFHPLSIALLARQLKTQRVAGLGQRLEALIAQTPDNPLLASLNLSLERLDDSAQRLLPRLGVFQGGAWEVQLLPITELSEPEWQTLRPALEATGLIQPELLPGVNPPYLKFHPTLAPALWSRLTEAEQTDLLSRYRQWYYQLSGYLYQADQQNPHAVRAIAQRELPNLLAAVQGASAAEEEWAVDFVDKVNRFLYVFGLNRDQAALTAKVAQIVGNVGSQSWYLARNQVGEQLLNAGRAAEAAGVFEQMLVGLGGAPSYNRCLTLGQLGRCLRAQGQAAEAAERYCQGLAVAAQLPDNDSVKQQMGAMQADLADALTDMGDYEGAKAAYEVARTIATEQDNTRQMGVVEGQLGTLALVQGNLPEAEQCYQAALTTFQQLAEPTTEAVFLHQLGMVYGRAQQWDAAEQAYREATRIKEAQGDRAGAAKTWNQLANVNILAGRPVEAEAWYRKAIEGGKVAEDWLPVSKALNNLADLLQSQPDRLSEARQLAEESLKIKQTLDPAAATIWQTYTVLAKIADRQDQPDSARDYRRLARQTKAAFAGTQYELQKFEKLIAVVVAAVQDAEVRQELESALQSAASGRENFVAAIQRILTGERDEDSLCDRLGADDSMIVITILRRIADSA